ncbi:MAG: permease [Cyclobacteriaceae bacterium]|nr:permease [Cyclobacteriaceae bacterium]
MIQLLEEYILSLWNLTVEMSPYLLLGFLIAGILHVFMPKEKVTRYLGKNDIRSTINAALIGIPLPLCSCGVIPTGISFFKNGASRGATVSFFISTPQTGVDSIFATYALLGLPLAIIRPIIALVTGVFGGVLTNRLTDDHSEPKAKLASVLTDEPSIGKNKLYSMLHYAFVEFLEDIAKWLIIGLLLAAFMDVLIPDDFFSNYLGNEYLSMLLVLGASVPLYVCATGSVPIAAVLMMKGLSPGAAIVFLMAGPATNAATMTVIGKVLGRKTLVTYLGAIIGGALISGVIVNELLPAEWFLSAMNHNHSAHGSHLLPQWLSVGSSVLMIALLAYGYIRRFLFKSTSNIKPVAMNEKTIKVSGMTCNHCKANVQKNIGTIAGIESIDVDLATGYVRLKGDKIDLGAVKGTVEGIGYGYEGEGSRE